MADIDNVAGQIVNTATLTSKLPGSATGPSGSSSKTVTLTQDPAISLVKTGTLHMNIVSPNGISNPGDTITYTFTVMNTGNVTLTNVTVNDSVSGVLLSGLPILSLAPGQSDTSTYTASYTLKQLDIDAGTFSNSASVIGTTPTSNSVTNTASDTRTIAADKQISLVKTGTLDMTLQGLSNVVDAGDKITYTFSVSNPGNVTLTGVTVSDLVTGVTLLGSPIASLAPGQSDLTTYTASHTFTQAEINSGTFTNSANVTAKPPSGVNITNSALDTKSLVADKQITLIKTGVLDMTVKGRSDIVDAGDVINYSFTVSNPGNVTLTNVAVTDPKATITGGPVSLAPGETDSLTFRGSYTLKQSDLDAGIFTNTATVSATPPIGVNISNTASDTKILSAASSIDLVKTGQLDLGTNGRVDAGDVIAYAFLVTNTGNVTLTNVTVSENTSGVNLSGSPISSLGPGQTNSTAYTASYTLSQADVDAGTFTNSASVTGKPPSGSNVTMTASDTRSLASDKQITLVKTGTLDMTVKGPATLVDAGDVISYTFTVSNPGNLTLNTIVLADAKCDSGPTYQSGDTGNLGKLDLTETWTYTCDHVITQANIDDPAAEFVNSATVTSKLPNTAAGPTSTASKTISLQQSANIDLVKTGTLNIDVIAPADKVNAGDTITYAFKIKNLGNVTLKNVRVTDPMVSISGGPITLSPEQEDNTSFTGTYTLLQADLDKGTFSNTATATGTPPDSGDVSHSDTVNQHLSDVPLIGIAKRVIGIPVKVSPGVWDVTFEFLVRNYGNITLDHLTVTDDLDGAFKTKVDLPPSVYQVNSLTSSDFTVNWPGYDGSGDINLINPAANDSLGVDKQGIITLVVRITPTNGGPFENSANARALSVTDSTKSTNDQSQEGLNPDPDKDGFPANNNISTPVEFGPNLFDPPFGIKLLDITKTPVFHWTMIWINDTNIVAINASVSDGIPIGTIFVDDWIANEFSLPAGPLPLGSVSSGVVCTSAKIQTTTTACYYEGPTITYPRGRIVWVGTLGPDLGVTDAAKALNAIKIEFNVNLNPSTGQVENKATIDADLNGNGDISDQGERQVSSASANWQAPRVRSTRKSPPPLLPNTGFSPGVTSFVPLQPPDHMYHVFSLDGLRLDIPSLGVSQTIVGVPQMDDAWDVSWLNKDIGYLEGTAFPTWEGNSALTGHVYLSNGLPGPFVNLHSLKWGDLIFIHAYGQEFTFEVRWLAFVDPSSTSVIGHKDGTWITLLTCKEFDAAAGVYKLRTAVQAVLIRVKNEPGTMSGQ